MEWYKYLAVFFSGSVAANVVPHFVHGISGNKFPSPFAKPPGKGLSSPVVNMVWSLFNIAVAWLLFCVAPIDRDHPVNIIIFFAGIAAMGIPLSVHFQEKHKE